MPSYLEVVSSTLTYTTSPQHADAAGYDSLVGCSLGRRERNHGPLSVIAEICIAEVAEPVADLAIADRVAYVLAHRTGSTFAVVAAAHTYLVVRLDQDIANEEAYALQLRTTTPGGSAALRMVSLATRDGITPIIAVPGA